MKHSCAQHAGNATISSLIVSRQIHSTVSIPTRMSSFFFLFFGEGPGEASGIFDQINLLQLFFQRIEIHVLGWDGHLCCLLKVRHLQEGRVRSRQESSHPQKFLDGNIEL